MKTTKGERPKHVCGLQGYDPMKGDRCPGCERIIENVIQEIEGWAELKGNRVIQFVATSKQVNVNWCEKAVLIPLAQRQAERDTIREALALLTDSDPRVSFDEKGIGYCHECGAPEGMSHMEYCTYFKRDQVVAKLRAIPGIEAAKGGA